MSKDRGTKGKRTYIFQKAQMKGVNSEKGRFWGSLGNPTIWTVLILQDKDYLIRLELSTKSMTPVSASAGRDSSLIWRNVSPSELGGRVGKISCSFLEPHSWGLAEHWKGRFEDWRSLKWLNLLKKKKSFLHALRIFFFFFCFVCFALMAEMRRVFISFRGFHLPQLKNKNFNQFSSVAQSWLTLYNPMDCSTPSFPVHHQLPELAQTHVHWVGNAIQASHPLLSPSPPVFNLSQHQRLF